MNNRPARTPGFAATPSTSGELSDWALGAGAATFGIAVVLWAGAGLACLTTGRPAPTGGPLLALIALGSPTNPAAAWPDPRLIPGPIPYWTATAVVVLAAVTLVILAIRGWARWRQHLSTGGIRSLPGLASPTEAAAAAGRSALLARAAVVRPSTANPPPANLPPANRRTRVATTDVGYRIGTVRGRELWCSVEDSALLVGPPRMGKSLHLVIPWVLDAPGPVLTTATRPDTLALTHSARKRRGEVAVFDPQRLAGLPGGLTWSPVRGCHSPRTALVRARGLAAGAGFNTTVADAGFWQGQTETALRCLLHAAALDGRGPLDLYRWSLNPVLAEDAITVLNRDRCAAPGWADALDSAVHADPRTRDSIWLGVRQSLAALADPDVLTAVNPGPGKAFDPTEFLRGNNTLYLLASAVASGSCAPLLAAFVEDITETARAQAARSPGARLDPPLLLALDEIANLTPLPSLPALMAEGGGSGITTLAVLQSLAQARHRWGEHAADTIWDAATVKLVLGGLAKMRDLDDIARLLGEIDEPTTTTSRGRAGERSSTLGVRQVPVMPPSLLRTLPFSTGVLILRQVRPVVVDLHPWTTRPDAAELRRGRTAIEAITAKSVSGSRSAGDPRSIRVAQ